MHRSVQPAQRLCPTEDRATVHHPRPHVTSGHPLLEAAVGGFAKRSSGDCCLILGQSRNRGQNWALVVPDGAPHQEAA